MIKEIVMHKIFLFFLSLIFAFSLNSFAQTYGNWSGILHTGTSKEGVKDPYFNSYSKGIQDLLQNAYKERYVRLITYVVKKGKRYTVSIKFPQDGVDRSMSFTSYNPIKSQGFAISYQNKNLPGKHIAYRVNFTNSMESDYENMVVIVSASKPSMPFYLRIEYPAVADNVVDSKSINPTYPEFGPIYWGRVNKQPILLK